MLYSWTMHWNFQIYVKFPKKFPAQENTIYKHLLNIRVIFTSWKRNIISSFFWLKISKCSHFLSPFISIKSKISSTLQSKARHIFSMLSNDTYWSRFNRVMMLALKPAFSVSSVVWMPRSISKWNSFYMLLPYSPPCSSNLLFVIISRICEYFKQAVTKSTGLSALKLCFSENDIADTLYLYVILRSKHRVQTRHFDRISPPNCYIIPSGSWTRFALRSRLLSVCVLRYTVLAAG